MTASEGAAPQQLGLPEGPVEVVPGGPVHGSLRAPASKSVTNRLLCLAALADGTSRLTRPLASDDSQAMADALRGLGTRIDHDGDDLVVGGTGGRLTAPAAPLDARLSGTTMRFLAAVAVLAPGPVRVTGLPPLLRRPIGPLTTALVALGGQVHDRDGLPPVDTRGGGLDGGTVVVDVRRSSQFASAVLLVAPYARDEVVVSLRGDAATAYVALTAEALQAWGARIEAVGATAWRVVPRGPLQARDVEVEYDASAAAHLHGLAMATGGRVTVRNTCPTRQPDAGVVEVWARMGGHVERDGHAVTVTGPDVLNPVEVDLSAMPDQVTTVAALAALAPGCSRLSGVGVARTHETDRLAALAAELARIGVRVDEEPGALVVHGGTARGGTLGTHDDHRLAMAFAALAARVPDVIIEEPWCVSKTYPAFWADLRALGATVRELTGS